MTNKMMFRRKNILPSIAIFIICLVISMPIYSANVLATSVSVVENYGTDGHGGYLNAESDTWTLGVSITNIDDGMEIIPEQVVLEVSESQIPFSSCSGDSLETTCEFQSVLSDGISEGTYPFKVILFDLKEAPDNESVGELGTELASDTDSIVAEGSEPSITFNNIYQRGEEIYLDFTVNDKPDGSCVGISEVEIIDSDSGEVLEEIVLDSETWLGVCEFDYVNDGDTSGLLSAQLDGEGTRHFKIRATDFLGHTETGTAKSFDTDFVAPKIEHGTLTLVDFGDYVGDSSQSTDVSINITECGELEEVTATSEYVSFYSQSADCDMIDDDTCLWECVWNDLTVDPDGNSVSAEITTIDEIGNEAVATVTATFTSDGTPPEITFLGTEFLYSDYSYVSAMGQNRIYALVSESGSGIDEESIALNLGAVRGSEWDTPDACYDVGEAGDDELTGIDVSASNYVCYWTISSPGSSGSTTTKEISVRYLEDKVGNTGTLFSQEIVVDGTQPLVNEIEFYGFSAIGEKDYFQSNDDLIIKMNAYDSSGLVVYIDADDIVMDAENKYMYGTNEEQSDGTTEYVPSDWDGWAIFTEEDCERNEESNWNCEFRIESIKSGYDSSANFEVYVTDTSGNEADWNSIEYDTENAEGYGGDYSIEIFALDEETQPDFWETSRVDTSDSQGIVDLDIAENYPARIMMDVGFRTDTNAQAVLIELDECMLGEESTGPELSRFVTFGGVGGDPDSTPKVNLILEFAPFDPTTIVDFSEAVEQEEFTTADIDYTCSFRIYSIIDETAINYAEIQDVTVTVPFGYTELGALDENVDSYIYDLTHTKNFQFLDSIKVLGKIVSWVRYLTPVISMILSLINIFKNINSLLDASRETAPGYAFASTFCNVKGAGEVQGNEVMKKISPFMEVFTCNPSPGAGSWYSQYLETVLAVFNGIKSANIKGGVSSVTLYDNIWVSIAGLCIPGVIYNLEKLRQIYCYQAKCLMVDVPAGLTTVTGCQKTFDILICKYWWGELIGNFVPSGIAEFLANAIKSFATNPLGLANTAVSVICAVGFCFNKSGGGVGADVCSFFGIVFTFVDIVNNIVGMVQSYPAVSYDLCASIGVDRNFGETEDSEDSSSVTTDDITAEDAGVYDGSAEAEA